MALTSSCRSLKAIRCSPLVRFLRGHRDGDLAYKRYPCRPTSTKKRDVSHANPWATWAPPSVSSSLMPEKFCRSCSTSYREGLDEQDRPSQSSSSTSLDISRDPSLETEDSSTHPGNEPTLTQTAPVKIAIDSTFKSSSRHDLAMLFTCTVCNVRSAKTMSRATYETGVVIVRCPGCQNLHLIADRYGWFGEAGSVEDFLAEKGIDVRKGSDSNYEFSVEDMAGWTPKGTSNK